MKHRHERWLTLAEQIALLSKDESKVGALFVAPDGTFLCSGYNGPARGEDDDDPAVWGELKNDLVEHAERNLIATAAKHGVRLQGGTIVVSRHPCMPCARLIAQSGIAVVVTRPYSEGSRWSASQALAAERLPTYGVEVVTLEYLQ